nr:MAG TPA: hypothetical protein [Caudoviricetes sp.]
MTAGICWRFFCLLEKGAKKGQKVKTFIFLW